MLFDSHAHINDNRFDSDRAEVISRAQQNGVSAILNAGACMESSYRSVVLAQEYDFIFAAVGVHPHDSQEITGEAPYQQLADWAAQHKVVAIGEIGLDYYYDFSPRDIQKKVFIRQIDLAKQLKMPIIIHDRDAHGDVLSIVKNEAQGVSGVFHCFSGSPEMMKEVIKLGFYVSIGGTVTFANSKKLKEIAIEVPLDKLLIETDCPYLTPHPYRGRRNEPAYVRYVAEEIAALRQMAWEQIAAVTHENARHLFGITTL